jgi:hypothetical protein
MLIIKHQNPFSQMARGPFSLQKLHNISQQGENHVDCLCMSISTRSCNTMCFGFMLETMHDNASGGVLLNISVSVDTKYYL